MSKHNNRRENNMSEESKQNENKQVENKQVENKPVETKQVESKPEVKSMESFQQKQEQRQEEKKQFEPKNDQRINKPVSKDKPKAQLDSHAAMLNQYLEQYKVLRSIKGPGKTDRINIINKFSVIIRHIITHPTNDVLDTMYNFFIAERGGLLSEQTVFQAISNINAEQRLKMEVFYTAFYSLIRYKLFNENFSLDMNAIRTALNNDAIVNYIAAKLNR